MGPDLRTTVLNVLLERVRQGDQEALDELLRRAAARLEGLALLMLRRFPRVRQNEQTADVVQEASLSLLGALKQLHFGSTREFYNLAAEHIRRRLLDLARRDYNPARSPEPQSPEGRQAVAPRDGDGDLDRWQALHEALEELPADCRARCIRCASTTTGAWNKSPPVAAGVHAYGDPAVVARLMALRERLGEGGLPNDVEAS